MVSNKFLNDSGTPFSAKHIYLYLPGYIPFRRRCLSDVQSHPGAAAACVGAAGRDWNCRRDRRARYTGSIAIARRSGAGRRRRAGPPGRPASTLSPCRLAPVPPRTCPISRSRRMPGGWWRGLYGCPWKLQCFSWPRPDYPVTRFCSSSRVKAEGCTIMIRRRSAP